MNSPISKIPKYKKVLISANIVVCLKILTFLKLKNLFIYFERVRASGEETETGGEKENPKQAPHCQCRAQSRT